MAGENLKRALRDLARWSEGDETLHLRLQPGSTVERVPGGTEIVDWLSIAPGDGQSFRVGLLSGKLVTERVWYEGMDAWETAGRPSAPDRQPRLVGLRGPERALSGDDPDTAAFVEAVLALHRSYAPGQGGTGPAEREDLAERVEAAIRGIVRAELSAAGVPDWLLEDTGYDEAPAPGM